MGQHTALRQTRRELVDNAARVERAEAAVEVVRAKAARELEAARSGWAADLEEARDRATVEAERARIVGERLEMARATIGARDLQIGSFTFELKATEMRAMGAEEAARAVEVKAMEREAVASAAEARVTAAGERALAAEARATTVDERARVAEARAAGAIDEFRRSRAFEEEVAEASTDAYLLGFADSRDKVGRVLGLSNLEGIKPDDAPEELVAAAEPARGEAAPAEGEGATTEAEVVEVTPTLCRPRRMRFLRPRGHQRTTGRRLPRLTLELVFLFYFFVWPVVPKSDYVGIL